MISTISLLNAICRQEKIVVFKVETVKILRQTKKKYFKIKEKYSKIFYNHYESFCIIPKSVLILPQASHLVFQLLLYRDQEIWVTYRYGTYYIICIHIWFHLIPGKFIRQVPARKLWFAILDSQIETGTPYMLYKDSCNRKSNQQNLGKKRF